MRRARGVLAGVISVLLMSSCATDPPTPVDDAGALPVSIRVATFNIRELSTAGLENVDADGVGQQANIRAAAEIVARIAPDILIVQEIDHDYRDAEDLALNGRRLRDSYLSRAGAGSFPYVFAAPCNTGHASGHDLNNDGRIAGAEDVGGRGYGEDCWGFGQYPGQYSMVLLSRFQIDTDAIRTFRGLRWRDLPGHHIPEGFYDPAELEDFPLSSKSHWDVPIVLGEARLHLWISHPTPAVFDGDEDRNGRRNYDEIAFWQAYLDGEPALYDDQGGRGGFDAEGSFIVVGDLNSDPRSDNAFYDGHQSIDVLLSDPRFQDTAELCVGDAEPDNPNATAVFAGGLRVDYLLPGSEVVVTAGGVYWPSSDSDPEGHRLAEEASDHRLVWIDIDTASLR